MSSWKPISDLVNDVVSKKVSAESLVQNCLDEIKANQEYNSILAISQDALKQAKDIDLKISKGEKVGRLAGVPFLAKDNYLTRGVETTAASNILKGFIPPFDSTVVSLLKAEGAIMVAKTNLDSFAHGSSTENSDFGTTLNPHDKTRVPGGSSGGSAAAVALGIAPFALGTDTGGSIRLPASFTGTVGYKPTYGIASRYGVVAMASSTDVLGPITNTVEDTALIMDIIAKKDRLDSTTIERDPAGYLDLDSDIKGKKIGLMTQYLGDGVQEEVKSSIMTAAEKLEKAGAEVVEVEIPEIDKALAVYYIVMPAEVSSNLSRYDGVRYGYRSEKAKTLDETYEFTRSEGFNDEVKRRVMLGTYVLSSGYYDAFYKKAQAVRTILIENFDKVFDDVDFLLGPTSPTTAFKIGENTEDPLQMYLTDIMTVSANLVGIPAISVPASKDQKNLPIGVQLMAPQRHDRQLLGAAKALEGELA